MLALSGHTKPVRAMAFTPDGQTLVSGGDDAKVMIWDPLMGELVHTIPVGVSVRAIACHPDGERVCTVWRNTSVAARAAGDRDRLRFWQIATGKVATDVEPGVVRYWHLVAGNDPQEITIVDAESIAALAFDSAGESLYSLEVWQEGYNALADDQTPRWMREYSTTPPRGLKSGGWIDRRRMVSAFALSRDGRVAGIATHNWVRAGAIDAKSVPPGYVVKGVVAAIALSCDGEQLIGCRDSQVTVWDTAGGGTVQEFTGHSAPVEAIAAHPSEPVVASGSRDGSVIVWETTTGRLRQRYDWGLGPIHTLDMSPDGLMIAV